MSKYFEGYYCKDDKSVESISAESSRKVLQAISGSYPLGITQQEISDRTGTSYHTITDALKTLRNSGFVTKEKNRKLTRGRPKSSANLVESRAFEYHIENRNFALNQKEIYQFAPGYTKYNPDFIYAWDILVEKELQNEIYPLLVKLLKQVVTRINASDDPILKKMIPMTVKYGGGEALNIHCTYCGLNHEARDFIRAILLHLLDSLEVSRPFVDFLSENQFIEKDSDGYLKLLDQGLKQNQELGKQAKEWFDGLKPDLKQITESILKQKPSIHIEEIKERVDRLTNKVYFDEDVGEYYTIEQHNALAIIAHEFESDLGSSTDFSDYQRNHTLDETGHPKTPALVKKIVNVEQTLTKKGIKVTLHKVEFTTNYTRAFLKIENLRGIHDSSFSFSTPVLIQGKKQFGYVHKFHDLLPENDYNEINLRSIPPGVEEVGVAVFQAVDLTAEAPRSIKLRLNSERVFIFEVDIHDEDKLGPTQVAEDLTRKVVIVNRTQSVGGIFVTLRKLEFAEGCTAAFLTIKNKNTATDSWARIFDYKAIQGKREFGKTYAGPSYDDIMTSIDEGEVEKGVLKLQPLDQNQDTVKVELRMITKNGNYRFSYDVAIPKP